MTKENNRLGLANDFLFSFNLAYAATLAIAVRWVFMPLVWLRETANHLFGLDATEAAGGYLAFFLIAMLLAMLLFLSVTGSRRISVLRRMLALLSGIAALGVSPACWCYIEHASRLEVAEGPVALALGALFFMLRLRLSVVFFLLIMSVHYGFWIWLFWESTNGFLGPLLPIVGLLSCIVWVASENRANGDQRS